MKIDINFLKEKLKNSYSPYSKFPVCAVLVSKSNKKYYGVNIENISFPVGICAEKSAGAVAISAGEKINSFLEIHIFSKYENYIFPCGSCRQFLQELGGQKLKVYVYKNNGKCKKFFLKEIFPEGIEKGSILANDN